MAFNGSYIKPYGTPLGQLILLFLLSCYVGALVWMRQMSKGKPQPRFLGTSHALPGQG